MFKVNGNTKCSEVCVEFWVIGLGEKHFFYRWRNQGYKWQSVLLKIYHLKRLKGEKRDIELRFKPSTD